MITEPLVKLLKISTIIFFLDILWIKIVSGKMFTRMIENIQGSPLKINMTGAIAAYMAIIALFYMFVSDTTTNMKAFLLGFLAYAIYDFTSHALFDNWELKTAVLDALWGGALFLVTKIIVYN